MTASAQEKLDYLRSKMAGSDADRLYRTSAARLVFGEGNPRATLMVVGEAPDSQEDRTGRPFSGRPGALLDRVLAEVGVSRDDLYIANLVKRRPPGNRAPEPSEIEVSLPWLRAQIAIVQPRVLLCVGRYSGNALAGTENMPLAELRQAELAYVDPRTGARTPLLVTYHPAHVDRQVESGGVLEYERMVEDVRRAVALAAVQDEPPRRGGMVAPKGISS